MRRWQHQEHEVEGHHHLLAARTTTISSHLIALLTGITLGACIMYFTDPLDGARRRALVRNKAGKYVRRSRRTLAKKARDRWNRMHGIAAEARGRLHHEPLTDRQLCERVRAAMGHVIDHAHCIDVDAHDGVVMLSGPVLVDELEDLVRAVAHVRGVCRVINALEEHEDVGSMPGYRGSGG